MVLLERRQSDQNYDKLTKSTKSNTLTVETKNNIIVTAPIVSQYYEDGIDPVEARDNKIFNIKDLNPFTVANEQKLMKH